MTIGFFTNDCFFEQEKSNTNPAANIVPQTTNTESTGSTTNNPLHSLPDLSTLNVSETTVFDSLSGAPANEEANASKTSIEFIVLLIILTILICSICSYFILKNRGSCFRKLSDAERGEHHNPADNSQRGTGIEISAIDGQYTPDVSAREDDRV